MTAPDKVNGDFYDDKLTSEPRAQRKPRLNRRGFHLSNHPLMQLLPPNSDKKKISVNGCDESNKITSDSSQKKIISLSSAKHNTSETHNTAKDKESSSTVNLKKSSSSPNRNDECGTTEDSNNSSPPKKKHKPITWP